MTSLFSDTADLRAEGLQLGDHVVAHYSSKTLEGGLLETTTGRQPLEFQLGDPGFVPGLSEALLGHRPGERLSVRLSPDNSFGHRRPDWQVLVPLDLLPTGIGVGDQIQVSSLGATFPGWVQKIQEHEAVVDVNHPMADETTLVEIEIVSAQSPQASKNG